MLLRLFSVFLPTFSYHLLFFYFLYEMKIISLYFIFSLYLHFLFFMIFYSNHLNKVLILGFHFFLVFSYSESIVGEERRNDTYEPPNAILDPSIGRLLQPEFDSALLINLRTEYRCRKKSVGNFFSIEIYSSCLNNEYLYLLMFYS